MKIELLDVVVLLKSLPAKQLQQGALGTIVEIFDDQYYLVEFADLQGVAYAMAELPASALMKVVREPLSAAN